MPQKLTNDSAEFSFRQLAIARMKYQQSDEKEGGKPDPNTRNYSQIYTKRSNAAASARGRTANKLRESGKKYQSIDYAARRTTIAGQELSPDADRRLDETLQNSLKNPQSRIYQPTFQGFLADQMSPQKGAMDNKPTVVGKVTRVPGQIGWGIERKHLKAESKIITDDMRVPEYPIPKHHLAQLDNQTTAQFTRFDGDRAEVIDKKLGVFYDCYHSLNM